MKRNLLPYLLTLVVAMSCTTPALWAQGRSIPKTQEAREQEIAEPGPLPEGQKYRYPLWNGLGISVDVFEPLMGLFANDYANYEAQVMVNLHHRFFPMASVGMGRCDATSDNGNTYGSDEKLEHTFRSTLSPFFKVGCGYDLHYNTTKPGNYYLLFLRYGCSWNTADIEGLYYYDGLWKPHGPIALRDQHYTTHWVEVGAMLNVQVAPHITLGWDVYYKVRLAQSGTAQGSPYWVPGYGRNDNHIGFLFRVGYTL